VSFENPPHHLGSFCFKYCVVIGGVPYVANVSEVHERTLRLQPMYKDTCNLGRAGSVRLGGNRKCSYSETTDSLDFCGEDVKNRQQSRYLQKLMEFIA
jgi:hypothetical protein